MVTGVITTEPVSNDEVLQESTLPAEALEVYLETISLSASLASVTTVV